LQHEIDVQDDEDTRYQRLVGRVEGLIIDWEYDQIDELIAELIDDGVVDCSFSFFEYLSEVESDYTAAVLIRQDVEKYAGYVADMFFGCLTFK